MYETDKWSEYQGYDPKGESIEDIVKRLTAQQSHIASAIQEVKEIGNDVQFNRSLISQTATEIRQEVYQRIENGEGTIRGEFQSSISQTASEIRSEVSGYVADLDGKIASANSSITQNANQIALRVRTTDYNGNTIASLINQTATTITIAASKINLVGAVTVLSAISNNLGTITAGSISLTGTSQSVNIYNGLIDIGTSSGTEVTFRWDGIRYSHNGSYHASILYNRSNGNMEFLTIGGTVRYKNSEIMNKADTAYDSSRFGGLFPSAYAMATHNHGNEYVKTSSANQNIEVQWWNSAFWMRVDSGTWIKISA